MYRKRGCVPTRPEDRLLIAAPLAVGRPSCTFDIPERLAHNPAMESDIRFWRKHGPQRSRSVTLCTSAFGPAGLVGPS